MIRHLSPVLLAAFSAGCGLHVLTPEGAPVPVVDAALADVVGTPTAYVYGTDTPDRPGSWLNGAAPDAQPGLARRAGWDHNCVKFTNTGVLRRPDYFESPFKDIQATGHGEPQFYNYPRDVVAGVYEPARWLVNLAASPVSAVLNPYWNRVLDYGPLPADRPAPPREVVVEPRVIKVDE